MRIKILITILNVLALLYLVTCWHFSNLILFPESSLDKTKTRIEQVWKTTYEEMMQPLPKPENFKLTSFDGIELRGKHFRQKDTANCAIILVHGWTSTWAGMLKYTPVLWDCGCDLVMYDHRVHGESGGTYATGGINEAKDLIALTNWFQKKTDFTDKQVGWFGASWGAATVLTAGADEKNVAFIIADAPFQDWETAIFERAIKDYGSVINLISTGVMTTVNWRAGIDYREASAIKATSKTEEPILLLHSSTDEETGHEQSVNISAHLKAEKSMFHLLDWGGLHTQDVIVNQAKFGKVVHSFLGEIDGFDGCKD